MGDRNRNSASEELLGQARGASAGGDDFVLESPVDDYVSPHDQEPSASFNDASDMSAEEIASALLEASEPEPAPEPEPVVDPVEPTPEPVAASSLPSWATEEPSRVPRAPEPVVPSSPAAESGVETMVSPAPSSTSDDAEDVWIPNASWDTASPEWEAREAEMRAKKQRRFDIPVPRTRVWVSLGVILLLFGSFLVNVFDGKDPIQDAGVGDCFISGGATEVDQVPIVDCSEPHDAEVFAIFSADEFGSSYPGEDPLFDWLFDECLSEFTAYTGESYQTSRYWIDGFIPTPEGWRQGDHDGMCTLVVLEDDEQTVRMTTGSGRRSNSA